MAPMQSTELSPQAKRALLTLARRSIEQALHDGRHDNPLPQAERELDVFGASFVTLRERETQALRGCCGSLEARMPLVEDVWRNARASAFADPRFPGLTPAEWPDIEVHVSVLSVPEPMTVSSEPELL